METETSSRRPKFGNRFLKDPSDVFQHNAWDNVEWDEEQEILAQEKVRMNSTLLPRELHEKYEKEASEYWDKFYGIHQNRFFKDRHWLFTEFPELAPNDVNLTPLLQYSQSEHYEYNCSKAAENERKNEDSFVSTVLPPGKKVDLKDRLVILEVGCGAGNTVFPILEANIHPNFFIYCCDFSPVAVSIVQNSPAYDESRCKAFVWDVTDETAELPFPKSSLDIITLIFVLSAVNPEKLGGTIKTLSSYLKPGGVILFRDYGRYDMAELRFKPGHCLQEHFYVRGDGTRVYFFTQEELHDIFTEAGLEKVQNVVDRRLQVNRGKLLKMYRVWIQMKYIKPVIRH